MTDRLATVRTRLLDPESVPFDPAFDDPAVRGEPVPAARLTPAALRERFATSRPWQQELRNDPRLFDLVGDPRRAAVLVPLFARGDAVNVLLTQRAAHLNDHAGQISFPGGRVESGDADAVATALREAEEEIGLPRSAVQVMGALPEYLTATGYDVAPVVGLVEHAVSLTLDTFEVDEAFEVPLAFLMNPANHQRRLVTVDAVARTFYAMPYSSEARSAEAAEAPRARFIWGATAAILRNLYHFLRA